MERKSLARARERSIRKGWSGVKIVSRNEISPDLLLLLSLSLSRFLRPNDLSRFDFHGEFYLARRGGAFSSKLFRSFVELFRE